MILDGIRYRIFSTGCIVGIMGLFLAIVSVVHDKKYLAASFLSLAFSLIYVTKPPINEARPPQQVFAFVHPLLSFYIYIIA